MKTIKIITLFLIITLSLAQDPSEILGTNSDSSSQDIISAFKKNALRYHPDSLEHTLFRSDNLTPIEKIQKFYQLVQAYSQLKYKAAQIPQIELNEKNYREFYYKFFNEIEVCGYDSQQELQCEAVVDVDTFVGSPFFASNTTEVSMQNIGEFFERDTFYYVVLYSDPQKYDKDNATIKTWRKLGNKNKEWFKVWALNCSSQPEICEVIFDVKKDVDYEGYSYPITGERTGFAGKVTSVTNFSNLAMQILNEIEIQELYEPNFHIIATKASRADKKLAILFTEKHNTPKVWKLLQNKFDESLVLTTVGSSNKKMIEKFGVTKYPTLMVLEDPQSISTAIIYEGKEFKKENMSAFLAKHSKQAEVVFEEYTQEMVDAGKFCGKDDKFCLIFNLQNDYSLLESVINVPQQYKKKNIRFLYVKEGFSSELENQPGFVFIKSKRQRYAYVKKSSIGLSQFIDDALESAVNFEKMPEEALKNVKTTSQKDSKKEEL